MSPIEALNQPATAKAEDEWTFVKPKRGRSGRPGNSRQPEGGVHEEVQVNRDESTLRSPEDIAAEYRRVRSHYEKDGSCATLRRLVRDIQGTPLDRAVCLGIGTFDPPDGGWETKKRTFLQLSAFLVMVDVLKERPGSDSLECFFQEPLFTKSDRAFLEGLGPNFRVVDSPDGFDKVNARTLLYGVHLYRPIYAKALEKATPSIFVGTTLDVWDTVSFGQATEFLCNENVKTMDTTYQKRDFPPGNTTAFSSTSIYWSEGTGEACRPSAGKVDDIYQLTDKMHAAVINEGHEKPLRGVNTPI